MSDLALVVPVKSSGKSRLSPVLSAEERRALSVALFRGVMKAVRGAGLIGSCLVVSSDSDVLSTASKCGATPVEEPGDRGVNAAVERGMGEAGWAAQFLVIPSDLPLLKSSDLTDLLRLRAAGVGLLISPSAAFDGTNALLFPRGLRFPLSYDRDSFWNHLRSASELGLRTGIFAKGGVMFDVDSPEDLRALAASASRSEAASIARGALR
ncbi:MAG: 2-phospho-L-lactate guanylyltransferase [Nitrososphaerota archaeon]|nr:2-phospho-L-lactate guanylyltransferase [Nitrososphaerota archaeon]